MTIKILPKDWSHIYMSPEEIDKWYGEIKNTHDECLKSYWVKLPNRESFSMLWIIYLSKYKWYLVHKDTIAKFVKSISPKAWNDQQIRHLASYWWYVLNAWDLIPNTNEIVKPWYHMLYDLGNPKPNFIHRKLKRVGRVGASNFEELKAVYNYCCATCGAKEWKPHPDFNSKVVKLQQWHMNPNKRLEISNTIPQCQICNQQYKDYFVFNERGRVIEIASEGIVLKSSRLVQKKVFEALKRIFKE